MTFTPAQRLRALPPYLFAEIDRKKRAAIAAGKDVISFGLGDPDQPTPDFIVKRMQSAVAQTETHQYPPGEGSRAFKEAVASWFQTRFKVELDPERQVLMLIGSKEGLGHLPLACLNPKDAALIPSPGYPVYRSGTIFAGATPIEMVMSAQSGWLPDLDAIPPEAAKEAKLMILNYPNNPTGAVADKTFYERALSFAKEHDILIAQDAAYSEVWFDHPPPSLLQLPGGMDTAVEFYSLSKTFNMTGWRIGFAVGHPDVLAALAKVKTNLDSGQFLAIQMAAIEALAQSDHLEVRAMLDLYRERREVLLEGLSQLGFEVSRAAGTFYVWVKVPSGHDSMLFASTLLEQTNVVVVPGVGFGQAGEGYFRLALTVDVKRIREAIERMRTISL